MSDVVVLTVALVLAYLPGLLVLDAVGVRPGLVALAGAPAVSVSVAGVVAVVAAVVGFRYGPLPLGLAVLLLVVLVVVVRRRSRRTPGAARRLPAAGSVAGAGMVAVGAGFAVWPWLTGLGGLATRAQEHDMIIHVMQSAYITRSGRAAPWQLIPADVLTGEPVWFYPSGTHLLAAATAGLTGGNVTVAVNAMTVVLLAVSVCVGVAGLTRVAARQLAIGPGGAMLAAGFASLVMAGMYRPGFHLMHDGGILGNAVALSLVPGVVAVVVLLGRLRPVAGVGAALAVVGAVWAHPSGAVSVAVTVLAWWFGMAVTARGRAELRRAVLPLVVAAPVTVALLVPVVGPGVSEAGRTGSWPADTGPVSFIEALGETFGFPYSGWIDQAQTKAQVWVVVLVVVGVLAVVALRRGMGPVAAWAAWSVVVMAAWLSPASGFDAVITQFYYNAMLRTWSHVSLLGSVLAGVGVVLSAHRLAVFGRLRIPLPRPVTAARIAAALVVLVFVGYAAAPAVGYARINENAVATRYGTPDFVRIGDDDLRAIDWLAARIQPGERVFNSPNDGSTYLYVERGIPVVNVYTLGLAGIPYTYRLLEDFNTYPENPEVRRQLVDLDVRWIYVDERAPRIGSVGSPEDWAGDGGFQFAPGLAGVADLPGVRVAHRSGSVVIYRLTLDGAAPLS